MDDILAVKCAETPITTDQLFACKSAEYWIYSQDEDFPDYGLSFTKVCGVLNIDHKTIMERLDLKIKTFALKKKLKELQLINGSTDYQPHQASRILSEWLENKMLKYGHRVEIHIDLDMKVECSNPKLTPLCRMLLKKTI